MTLHLPTTEQLASVAALYHPGLAVDCVIFGFHSQQLKVLLLEPYEGQHWSLPGGFVLKDEDVDNAATTVLKDRTGLSDIFLRQFHLFGTVNRMTLTPHPIVTAIKDQETWFSQRFVSMGYYALVDYTAVNPQPNEISKSCEWWELNSLPLLIQDHQQIINQALMTLQQRIRQEPIGYQLLPEKFTMPELLKLYEAILGRELDRRNFQRKMLSYKILNPLEERRQGGAHKAPRLYSFNVENYQQALEHGLQGGW